MICTARYCARGRREGVQGRCSDACACSSKGTSPTCQGDVSDAGKGVQRGGMYDRDGKRNFDLNSMSPFMAYYMATQVGHIPVHLG